jgi:rare lipoprotein A (peptidoglycan hydrolase)
MMLPWRKHGVSMRRWLRWHEGTIAILVLLAVLILSVLATHAHAETGIASWYSGGGTFCGDRVVQPFTAAHKALPCGAVVRVTTRTGRSVIVTIRDRGPFIRGRVIDLDRVSAGYVGLIGPGVLPVTVERLR